jgi:6-phosphogluconolactonase
MTVVLREVLEFGASALPVSTAALLADVIRNAVRARGVCHMVLAGGRTPAAIYRALAMLDYVPWEQVHVYVGDERCVPPTHPDSNFTMISANLLTRVAIPETQVHRLRGDVDPDVAVAEYDALLQLLPAPCFDLVLTGAGADGHTASLFPGDPNVQQSRAFAMRAVAPAPFAVVQRITLTLRALCSTRVMCVLCPGDDKRAMRTAILSGDVVANALPVALMRGSERTVWVV